MKWPARRTKAKASEAAKPSDPTSAEPDPVESKAKTAGRAQSGQSSNSGSLVRLKAEDAHATNRLALYRAKMYGRPSGTVAGDSRLRQLERVREGSRRRLREALAAQAAKRRTAPDPADGRSGEVDG